MSIVATSLLPVLYYYEKLINVANFTGFAFGADGVRSYPTAPSKLPIITTWMGVDRSFDLVLRLWDSSKRVVSLHSEKVEPTNEWGYRQCVSLFELSVPASGLYTFEVLADNKPQLEKPFGFDVDLESVNIDHDPQLAFFIVAQLVTGLGSSSNVDAKNIMSDSGIRSPFGFLLGWRNCKRGFSMIYELLDVQERVMFNYSHQILDPKTTHNFIDFNPSVHFSLSSFPAVSSGVYWYKLSFLDKVYKFSTSQFCIPR